MGPPHRLDVWAGHRAVCSGGIVDGLLDVLKLEAVVEVFRVGLRLFMSGGGGGGGGGSENPQ